jgi:arabinoxylan arabinofuranohydrolase
MYVKMNGRTCLARCVALAILLGCGVTYAQGEDATPEATRFQIQAVAYTFPSEDIRDAARAYAAAAKEKAGEGEEPEKQTLVTGIRAGSFIEYHHVPMNGRDTFLARIASAGSGQIEIRRADKTGRLLGTIDVPATGGLERFATVSGAMEALPYQDHICLVFRGVDGEEEQFVLDWIAFQMSVEALAKRQMPRTDVFVQASRFSSKSDGPSIRFDQGEFDNILTGTKNGNWILFDNVDFPSDGVQSATVRFQAANHQGGWIELRLDGPEGELLGRTMINPLDRRGTFNSKTFGIRTVSGRRNLCVVFKDDLYEAEEMIMELNWISFSAEPFTRSGNPIITHMRTADPSARVWPDDPDTIWVYPSHDPFGQIRYETMDGYHAFSSTNLVVWTDHGEILHSRDVPWGTEQGGWMWAPCITHRNGKYYLYFPHRTAERGPFSWRIGVAMSDVPQGPFTNATMVTVEGAPPGQRHGSVHGIDPAVLKDDDGEYYLYWGRVNAGRLLECMTQISKTDRAWIEVTNWAYPAPPRSIAEGPYIHKHNGKYYLSWTWLGGPGYQAYYAMGDNPLGPFEFKGAFNRRPAGNAQNHHSMVEYKGEWYFFYHVGGPGPRSRQRRMVSVNKLEYNPDGTIKMVEMDWEGVEGIR